MSGEQSPDPLIAAKKVRERQLDAFQREVQPAVEALNFYIDAFNSIGSYTAGEHPDPKLMMLALCSRSFNSAFCAHELLLDGYYPQAIMLLRHLAEDWLTSHQIAFDATVRGQLASGARVSKSFQQMADEISVATGKWWRATYGLDSEIAHPRMTALAIQVTGAEMRVGSVYDEDLAYYTFARLLLGLARMGAPLAQTVDLIHEGKAFGAWSARFAEIEEAIGRWYDEVSASHNTVVEARSEEPPAE